MDWTGVGTVCVWIWAVVFVVHGQNYVNVARGKTYRQSNHYSKDFSSRGANGDTSGYFPANCIHTAENGDLNPWWEVDLGQSYPVYNIDLWARTKLKARLYPSVITVDGQTCTEVTTFPNDTRKQTVTCSAIMKGRTVRITRQASRQESNADKTLNMCEMEIWVCADGWYGQYCSTRCPSRCQNAVCDRQIGNCSQGCHTGYTGARCAECADRYYKTNSGTCTSCSSNCLNQLCDKTSSRCNGCITGRYGDKCTAPCPLDCLNACDQQSGKCSSCKDGLHGDHCSVPCPTGCLNDVCEQSGKCASCKGGWFGEKCSPRCPTGCVDACDQQSGKCASCKDGLHGDQCSTRCPTGCVSACDQQSGKCASCKDGLHGDQCSTRCSTGCVDACDQQSGKCASCKDGLHGDQCSTPCPKGCLNDRCLQSGLCSSCKAGYTGSTCSEVSEGGDKETVNTTAIIGSVIGGALILGICVIILGIIILKRRSVRSEETRQNNQVSNDLNLSPTSPRPDAPGDREERTTAFQAVQEQEQPYEIAEVRAKATSHVSPEASAISDTVYQQSEADSANPYDLPTESYYNTGDVHHYDH